MVLVTGASSGIGEAVAHRAAARGDHLVLLARSKESLERVAAECDARGAASTLVAVADVSDDAQVAAAVAAATRRHDRIDEVISSAGVVAYGRIEDVPADVFDQVVRPTCSARSTSPATSCRSCAPRTTAAWCSSARSSATSRCPTWRRTC